MISGLWTDLYELTMMQGYFYNDHNPEVVFDFFYRKQPFDSGYSVFAGLEDLLRTLKEIQFSEEDIQYLQDHGLFHKEFLDYLKAFRFTGTVNAMPEGTIIFPNEPVVQIKAPLIEAQLIESILLNTLNFQTLIATKAARIYLASGQGKVLEFGLRRAQGQDGALSATRAAYIGGCVATSNTYAGKKLGIPAKGTMAHSWIMSFDTEEEAFMAYAKLYPSSSIFLIDTYQTLGSGIENAITAGKYLKEKGESFGVRLDSGDLEYLSSSVRKRLDEAGFPDAKIAVSNELNEEIVHQLVTSGAPIDVWGVGTHMVTGGSDSALTGVYKLAAIKKKGAMEPVIKISNQPSKTTNPGDKRVFRFFDKSGSPLADLLCLADEKPPTHGAITLHHPAYEHSKYTMKGYSSVKPMLEQVMKDGKITADLPTLKDIREYAVSGLKALNCTYARLLNPHIYKVSLSGALQEEKFSMMEEYSP
ncbi:MAG: nicotinate phosphoribosyltransferase [Spirochaetia bacterium]